MKKILYLTTTIMLSMAMFSLSSCLKDSRFVDFSKVGTLIEFPLEAFNGTGKLAPEALPISSTIQTFPVIINVASPKPLGNALAVTVKIDQAALTAYNNAATAQFKADSAAAVTAGTAIPDPPPVYSLLPANIYKLSSLTVTVPAGQRTATITVSVNTAILDPSAHFVLPLTISDASGQKISNYSTLLLNVQAKNQYDGIYTLTGLMHRDADLTLGGPVAGGITIPLATTTATAITFEQVWANGGALGGLNPVTIVINPTTNKVTSITSPVTDITSLPGYDNRYDPVKKVFYLSIIWAGTDPAHRSAVDTLTYSSVR